MAPGHLSPALNMSGSKSQATTWAGEQEAPADTGATQGTPFPLLLSLPQVASSEHPGQSWTASRAMLPRLAQTGLRCKGPRGLHQQKTMALG